MKKILVFSLAYYPSHVSGAEVAIKEITDRIDDLEFHLITLQFDRAAPREEKVGNVRVYRVGFGPSYFSKIMFIPLAVGKAARLHRALPFDAVWTMMTYMLFPAVLAYLCGVRVPRAVTIQDGDPYEKVFKRWYILPFTPLLDWGFRHASVVQTISTFLAGWARARGFSGPLEVVYNGASLQSGQAIDPEEIEALKKSLGKKENEVFLITVARLAHQKAQDVVIRALPLLPAQVRYLVVGEGEDRAMLESLARELGVAQRVVFVGQVDRTMTAKYRRASDIFVLPSRSEGQGISFASTMVAGLPIVGTQEGGIADFLFDARRNPGHATTGWAVDKDNPEQIADAVKAILADPKQAQKVVATAKEFATEHFDWGNIAKTMRDKVFARALAE